ncbi:MAG: BACON domain-containing protein [Phycisphaerae bacterium]
MRLSVPRWRSPFLLLPVAALVAAAVMAGLCGCSGPEEDIPPAVVKPVSAYGLTLDTTATPKQVAFVLLRSIADDVQAAQRHDTTRQKEALRLTYSLAAYSTIAPRIGESAAKPADAARSKVRDKRLYTFVKDWASIVAHYIRSFDTDAEAAGRKMRIHFQTASTVHLLYDVCHDPAETDPARQQKATIDIELTTEPEGALSYWRVAKITFAQPTIACSVSKLSSSCVRGTDAQSESFTVRNGSGGVLKFSLSTNQTWLFLSPTEGTSSGEDKTITINYATSRLEPGIHHATIDIVDPAATNNPQRIAVTLSVGAAVPPMGGTEAMPATTTAPSSAPQG